MIKTTLFFLGFSGVIYSKMIETESLRIHSAPDWLTKNKVEALTGKVQNFLEWDIRKIEVFFHLDEAAYKAKHSLNFQSEAFFKPSDQTIHLSPRIKETNFDSIFSHELVHAIFFQKYKGAIPSWLEEGLANFIGKTSNVDYLWLSNQNIKDVTTMRHANQEAAGAKYHYTVSTGLIEMIASKCSLKDLLHLSVGANMQTYLATYCEIRDLNASFQKWVTENSKVPSGQGQTNLDAQSTPWWKKPKKSQWWHKEKTLTP